MLRLNLNARDSGGNEASVVNTLGRFEDCALDEGRGQIVSVFDIALAGVAWGHAVAAIIVDATGQKSPGFHPFGLMVGDLLVQPGLNGIEQGPIQNGGLLAFEDLAFENDFADIEAIA